VVRVGYTLGLRLNSGAHREGREEMSSGEPGHRPNSKPPKVAPPGAWSAREISIRDRENGKGSIGRLGSSSHPAWLTDTGPAQCCNGGVGFKRALDSRGRQGPGPPHVGGRESRAASGSMKCKIKPDTLKVMLWASPQVKTCSYRLRRRIFPRNICLITKRGARISFPAFKASRVYGKCLGCSTRSGCESLTISSL